MTKSIFDVRLYRDGIRQLKVLGAVSAIFLMLEAILVPVYRMLIWKESHGFYSAAGDLTNIDLMSMHPMVLLVVLFTAPVMMLNLFRFLNHRNASDFYHSIPQTRQCLCFSYLGSVLTWVLGLQWASTFVSVLLHILMKTGTSPLYSDILIQGVSVSIVGILVAGGVLLAMSITGNTFSNVIVSGLILFAPRLIMLVLKLGVGNSLNLISSDQYLTFLGNGWNILTGLIYGFLYISENYRQLMMSAPPMLYTFALALVYTGLGVWFFVRRASESAGQASVSRSLQLVFRLTPAFLFGLIPDIIIFSMIAEKDMFVSTEVFLLGVLYLLSVILYFLYELISTRKIRNLKSALPGVAVLAAVNVAVVVGMLGMRGSILSFCPSADEIDSVSLSSRTVSLAMADDEEYGVYSSYSSYKGYLSSRTSKVQLKDENVRAIVAERLSDAVAYEKGESGSYDNSIQLTVGITVGGKTVYRQIPMTNSDAQRFSEALANEPAVQDIYMNLPDPEDPNLRLSLSQNNMDPETMREIYTALLQDVQDMGFAKWYQYTSEYYFDSDMNSLANLYMTYTDHMETTGSQIPISNLTPRAAAVYLQAGRKADLEAGTYNIAGHNLELLLDTDLENIPDYWFDGYCTPMRSDGSMEAGSCSIDLYNKDSIRILIDMLELQDQIRPEADSQYLSVYLSLEFYLDEEGHLVNTEDAGSQYDTYYQDMTLILPADYDWTGVCGDITY